MFQALMFRLVFRQALYLLFSFRRIFPLSNLSIQAEILFFVKT
jgi:hypothetical protein